MSHIATSSPAGRWRWRALAAALVIAAVACLVMWRATSDPGPSAAREPSPVAGGVKVSRATAPTVAPSARVRPVQLSIPRIDVGTRLIGLGLQEDGSVEVPQDPALAGWFQLGPTPGAAGSSVILGHVDSVHGPAVFYRLKELRPGDQIAVRLDDGTTAQFRVHSVKTYANADFPAKKVYGQLGRSQLNLVTCGGAYDASRGGYQSNVVVTTRLTV